MIPIGSSFSSSEDTHALHSPNELNFSTLANELRDISDFRVAGTWVAVSYIRVES